MIDLGMIHYLMALMMMVQMMNHCIQCCLMVLMNLSLGRMNHHLMELNRLIHCHLVLTNQMELMKQSLVQMIHFHLVYCHCHLV